MTRHILAILALTLSSVAPFSATAQGTGPLCAAREQVLQVLTGRHGESVRSIGLAAQNRIVEVFASDETGSWTITVTSTNGMTCLVASGRHYEDFEPAPAGDPL